MSVEKEIKKDFDIFDQYIKSKINEDNKGQIIFIKRKIDESVKIAHKIAQTEGLDEEQFYITKIYILIYYFRLLFLNEEIDFNAINENSDGKGNYPIEAAVSKFIGEVCNWFKVKETVRTNLKIAFKEFDKPVGREHNLSIRYGHDAVASIFGKKKIVKKLNTFFDEIDFHFPTNLDKSRMAEFFVDYLSKTRYYSKYAIENFLTRKIKNKASLITFIQKQRDGASLLSNKQAMTMIKTSSRNQVDLVSIADKKAGIMITVNSILLTILIPLFASYIFDLSSYIIPVTILVITCGLTILLATLATRPSIVQDKMSNEKIHTGQKSVFYFKNFANLSKSEFVSGVQELLTRDNAFEKTVFTDLYDVGIDLDRKYKRLRWCYTIFGSGIVLTMVSFLFCIVYFSLT